MEPKANNKEQVEVQKLCRMAITKDTNLMTVDEAPFVDERTYIFGEMTISNWTENPNVHIKLEDGKTLGSHPQNTIKKAKRKQSVPEATAESTVKMNIEQRTDKLQPVHSV